MKFYKVLAMFVVVCGVSVIQTAERRNLLRAQNGQGQQSTVQLKQQAAAVNQKNVTVSAFNNPRAQAHLKITQPTNKRN
jgi:hypothetical protein